MTKRLRALINTTLAIVFAGGLYLVVASCVDKPPVIPGATQQQQDQANTIYNADQIIVKLTEAQATIITANTGASPLIPDSIAVPLVQFIKDAAIIVHQTPNGWRAAVQTAYTQAKTHVSPADQTKYRTYFLLAEVLLGVS